MIVAELCIGRHRALRKDKAGAPHIASKLVHLVEPAIHDSPAKDCVPQVAHERVVGFGSENSGNFKSTPRTQSRSHSIA